MKSPGVLAGTALISLGVGLFYPPAGLVVAGIGLFYLGAWHRKSVHRSEES